MLYTFLVLGNLFIFLSWEHDFTAEVVYIIRMLWASAGSSPPPRSGHRLSISVASKVSSFDVLFLLQRLSSVLCTAVMFRDVKFGKGLVQSHPLYNSAQLLGIRLNHWLCVVLSVVRITGGGHAGKCGCRRCRACRPLG